MAETASQAERLADVLREMSVAEAARRLAAVSGNTPSTERRNLYRWLEGTRISNTRARQLAIAFDKPPEYFVTRREPTTPQMLNQQIAEVAAAVTELARDMERALDLLERLADDPAAQVQGASPKGRAK